VDIGACEHPGSPAHPVVVGDLDGDGLVTFGDLLDLVSTWGPATGCELADTDLDGVVDFGDLLTLLANWS
jgi:hypothetical protein